MGGMCCDGNLSSTLEFAMGMVYSAGSVLCAVSWPEGEFIGKLCAARGCPGRAGRESQSWPFSLNRPMSICGSVPSAGTRNCMNWRLTVREHIAFIAKPRNIFFLSFDFFGGSATKTLQELQNAAR